MNEITTIPITMTSREVVDLVNAAREHRSLQTGKPFKAIRYDNAKRVIDACVDNEVFTSPQFEETSFIGSDGKRQTATTYILNKRSAIIVAAQLSPEYTAAIVDRLEELEAKLNPKDPLLTMDAIPEVKTTVRLIREAQKAMLELSNRNCRAEFHDTITNILSGGCEFSMREDADMLLARLASFYEDGVRYYNVEKGYIQTKEGEWRCKPQLNFSLNGHLATAPKIADKERPARLAAYDHFLA